MYMKISFNNTFDIPSLLRTLQNPEERVQWDRDVESIRMVSVEDDYMPIIY